MIAGYRALTGKAVMLPRWAYGFWQSRQRYTTQDELLDVVAEYRKRKIPLDNIVLDWFYWKEDPGARTSSTRARFPDPKGMVDKVHAQNAQLMISVWPKFYPTTANYKELDAAGFMYRGNIEAGALGLGGPGLHLTRSTIRIRRPRATCTGARSTRTWACWASTPGGWMPPSPTCIPTSTSTRSRRASGPTAMGPAAEFFNSYSAGAHAAASTKARVRRDPTSACSSSRARAFAGIQRNAAAVWSGDIVSRWDDLYDQISAGVSVGYSGLPNWTFDIGGFANEARYSTKTRSPRISRNGASSTCAGSSSARSRRCSARMANSRSARSSISRRKDRRCYDSLVWHDRLRYRLLPYIYTVAGRHVPSRRHASCAASRWTSPTITAARDVRDEYLFGKAFLVAPVYQYKARSRPVYLPAGADAGTTSTPAHAIAGGQNIEAAAPLKRMPLFVRARLDRAGGTRDPVHGRETRRAHHACWCSPAPTAASTLRRRRRELRLREGRVRAHSRCVTTRPAAR